MCGVFGVVSGQNRLDIGAIVAAALNQLQNRGDYSAGIAAIRRFDISRPNCKRLRSLAVAHTLHDFEPLQMIKGEGRVSEVCRGREDSLQKLKGFMAIGQVRYPTAGYTFLKDQIV